MDQQNVRDEEHAPGLEEDEPMEIELEDARESDVEFDESEESDVSEESDESDESEESDESDEMEESDKSEEPDVSDVPNNRKINSPEPEYRKWSYFKCKEELVQAARDTDDKFSQWKKLPSLPQRHIMKMMNFLEQESMGQLSQKTRNLMIGRYHFKKIKFDTLDEDWNKVPNESSEHLSDEQRYYSYPDVKVITEDEIGKTETFVWDFVDSYEKSNYTFDKIELTTIGGDDVALEALIDYFKGYKPLKAGELVLKMDDMELRCEGWLNKLVDEEAVHTLTIPHLSRDLYSELRIYNFWETAKHLKVRRCFGNTGEPPQMHESVNLQQLVAYNRDMDFQDLSHFENLHFNVETITANDAWEYIKGYRGRNHPEGSTFFIGYPGNINCELLGLFDVPVRNQPIPRLPAPHTQIFLQSDPSLHFIVMFGDNYFRGFVWRCNRNN
ncbi:hypothetical protein CRE_07642 [Caenorhabditis remanei]|uniref:Uncharacterized protein n=1 Tax=Caenorhabditis remanei TaxID=31234 RepID=E3MPC8_CAERE|nr:hypothetical protein CRE_07642 [Caenorhabditis remanei]